MKTALAFCLFAICGAAQTLTLAGNPTAPGSTATLNLTFIPGTGVQPQPAALQWLIALPAGITATVTPGVASGTSAKNISCSPTLFCVASGVNGNLFQPGVVAIITFTMPANPLTIPINNVLGASQAGNAVVVTAGPPALIPVLGVPPPPPPTTSACDVNGDGKVDGADVALFNAAAQIAAAKNGVCVLTYDLDGDGKCDVVDIQRVSLAAMAPTAAVPGSGICRTGQ